MCLNVGCSAAKLAKLAKLQGLRHVPTSPSRDWIQYKRYHDAGERCSDRGN